MGGNRSNYERESGSLSLAGLLPILQPGSVIPSSAPTGTRFLISSLPANGGRFTRTYIYLANGQYEIATNCAFNNATGLWSKDVTASVSGLSTTVGGYSNYLMKSAGAGTWDDNGWSANFQTTDDFYSSNPLPALPFCYSATADGMNSNRGCILFPWRFSSPPTQVTFTTFSNTNMDGDPFADLVQTRCLFFQVYPITIGFAEIYGTVRVAP